MSIVSLKSGEIYFGSDASTVLTTLGSCVAFVVFDRVRKVGGMVHYLIPNRFSSGKSDSVSGNRLNFGDEAIAILLKKFKDIGSAVNDLEISILGGSFDGTPQKAHFREISKQNIECARSQISKFGLKLKREKVAMPCGLRVKFNPQTGDLYSALLNGRVRVLIVDDSAPIRMLLKKMLSSHPDIEVVGEAASALEAESLRKSLCPHVMTLDINMPEKDGVTYLSELMAVNPMPVIMISDLSLKDAPPVMRALELGAFDFVQKPSASQFNQLSDSLQALILAAAKSAKKPFPRKKTGSSGIQNGRKSWEQSKLIAIGASTGGTEALKILFSALPKQTPPILVVQHMPPVFTKAFADALDRISQVTVTEAQSGDLIVPNHAYIAPGGLQMRVCKKEGNQLYLELIDDPPVNRFKPSVDYLFDSIVQSKFSGSTFAALLTGMGDDGANGLLKLRNGGAYTVAQSEESCTVFGMPKAAIDRGAAVSIFDLDELTEIFN